MIEEPTNRTIVKVHPPKLHPQFTNIGFGNPRYNSMLICEDGHVLVTCGSTLRKVDLRNNEILLNRQIGQSQIFNIIENNKFIVVINYEGLISLLQKKSYEIVRQFYASGKQIRHSSVSQKYLVISCQLNHDCPHQSYLQIYSIDQICKIQPPTSSKFAEIAPLVKAKGHFYYPELIGEQIVTIWYDDPNPKGKSRQETVMNAKLPVKHKIMRGNIGCIEKEGLKDVCIIKFEGQILCATHNKSVKQIYYLHESKRMTIYSYETNTHVETSLPVSSAPHCIEGYQNGVLFPSKSSQLGFLHLQGQQIEITPIKIQSIGVGGNFAVKPLSNNPQTDFYLFNEYGLHLYCSQTHQTYSQACFDITNCGISLNRDASLFTVADFGGNVYTFTTESTNIVPHPLTKVCCGIPVRSIAWCHKSNKIMIGCVGGTFFVWDGQSQEANFVFQYDCTVNIIRYYEPFVLIGTADGFIHIWSEDSLEELYRFQAHFPIHYQNEKDRELFGSMKNYAEIWSIASYSHIDSQSFYVVTASQDQSEKVFIATRSKQGKFSHEQIHHLVGHSLAVTSIDWKNMRTGMGEVYVSCSDDKIVRFRDPHKKFETVHELETTTIKEWHTLTYLALEEGGHRVAIGSQNGYLFIFDIESKQLLFGQKIHLGGVEGLDWRNNKLVTCSSDLCISLISFD